MNAGVYSMSRDEYVALDRDNWSNVRYMKRSPAHYRHNQIQPRKDTAALQRGRVAHIATFEPERFRRECVVWDGDRRAGKAWETFKAQHGDMEILKEEEYQRCVAISSAARASVMAAPYLHGGQAEQTIIWEMQGLKCKGRVDFIAECAVVDLKTCRNASPVEFGKAVMNYDMCAQAAYYVDGYKYATGKALPYVLVAVEADAPYVVQVYRVPEKYLDFGRSIYQPLLEQLKECRRTGRWDGYSNGELELVLPSWSGMNDDEEDLTELGLVVNQGAENGF